MTAALILVIVAVCIASGFLLVRVARARAREAAREARRRFEDRLDLALAGRLRPRAVLRSAAKLAPEAFWDVVIGLRAEISGRSGRELERLLCRSRHVSAERRALHDASPARRELAVRRLAGAGASRARRSLHRTLRAGPEPVTLAAALALARIRDLAALRWVLAHPGALAHRSPRARFALLRAFGRGAAPHLTHALAAPSPDPRMERAIVEVLAALHHGIAAPAIAARLGHEWRDVRVAATRALGLLGATAHRAGVAANLRDPDWRVRAQAARALGRLEAVESIPGLRESLSDESWWVRRHAAYALLALGDEGRRTLREIARGERDRYAREMAAEALGGGFPRAS